MDPRPQFLRYPLILVPGLLGFIRLPGYPYWYGIDEALRTLGISVWPIAVSALHATEVRGEQLLREITRIQALTGADKVNLIGHSQGALTARYAAAVRPDLVASVTSVAGPNHGSELADHLMRTAPPGSCRERLLATTMHGIAWLLARLEREPGRQAMPLDARAARASLTSSGVAAFNQRFPQGLCSGKNPEERNGVRYYSWSGTLQPGLSDRGRNRFDPTNYFCRLLSRRFIDEAGDNDGMVGRRSSHLGLVIRDDYPFDHFDIVNHSRGRVGLTADPLAVYLEHAERLRRDGC